jgi:polysaccharide export outer membrane protein
MPVSPRCLACLIAAFILARAPGRSEPPPTKIATPQPVSQAVSSSYRLMPNDIVQVIVFGEEDMAMQARIDKEGSINMNLIGLVKISGQTIREAAKTIETQLKEYLVKPQVNITIIGYSKRRFTMLGQINRPGMYDLPDESSLNLLEAIGIAGGYTRIADPSKITLKRTVGGRETTQKLDAKSMGDKEAVERFLILPGDTITVGERIF